MDSKDHNPKISGICAFVVLGKKLFFFFLVKLIRFTMHARNENVVNQGI